MGSACGIDCRVTTYYLDNQFNKTGSRDGIVGNFFVAGAKLAVPKLTMADQ